MQVEEYLSRRGFEYRTVGGEANMNCPFCQDKERKFFVSLESGAFICHHAERCGKHGSFWQLQTELGDKPESTWKDRVRIQPASYRRPKVEHRDLDTAISAWFAGRKITAATISRFKIRQTPDARILFPYLKGGQLVNAKYRKLPKEFSQEKDAEPCLFGRDLVPADSDTLLIVEGEMDVLAFWEYEIVAVSVPDGAKATKWIAQEWDYLARFKKILLCLDDDLAGAEGVEAIIKRLGWRWDLYRAELPGKDANDCLMAGVPRETIAECIKSAKPIRPAEVVLLRDLPLQEVAAPDPGSACEIPGLTEILGGWRPGELTVHGGENYSGKTTATTQEATGALRRFRRVCIANFEMKMTSVVWNMTQQLGMDRADFLKSFGEDLIFIDTRDSMDIEKLLELMKYVSARYGAQTFVVDSLGCLEIPISDYWLQQKVVMKKFSRFAKDNEIHLHLVHHMRKPAKGQGRGANSFDLEGSAWISNLADNVILYDRIGEADRKDEATLAGVDEVLFVAKNRAFGTGGEICLRFDRMTKRFEAVG